MSVPVRRGVAAVAVTGGALSLMGAAAPVTTPRPADAAVTALGPVAGPVADVGVDEVALVSSLEPVTPSPDVLDATELVKAVQLYEDELARVEAERLAAEERAREEAEAAEEAEQESVRLGSPDCGMSTSGLGAVRSHVRDAAEFLGCLFGEPTMLGVAGRAGTSDHPSGLAVDFMVDRSTGDALAACALRNQEALGIKYVIWEQRINHGDGWESMEDRGGVTANHFDHVHVSFNSSAGSGELVSC